MTAPPPPAPSPYRKPLPTLEYEAERLCAILTCTITDPESEEGYAQAQGTAWLVAPELLCTAAQLVDCEAVRLARPTLTVVIPPRDGFIVAASNEVMLRLIDPVAQSARFNEAVACEEGETFYDGTLVYELPTDSGTRLFSERGLERLRGRLRRALTLTFPALGRSIELVIAPAHFHAGDDCQQAVPAEDRDGEAAAWCAHGHDVAVIALPMSRAIRDAVPLQLAAGITAGEAVSLCGFPDGEAGPFRRIPSTLRGGRGDASAWPGSHRLDLALSAEASLSPLQGALGGPVVAADGTCIGLLSVLSAVEPTALAAPVLYLQRLLEQRLPTRLRPHVYPHQALQSDAPARQLLVIGHPAYLHYHEALLQALEATTAPLDTDFLRRGEQALQRWAQALGRSDAAQLEASLAALTELLGQADLVVVLLAVGDVAAEEQAFHALLARAEAAAESGKAVAFAIQITDRGPDSFSVERWAADVSEGLPLRVLCGADSARQQQAWARICRRLLGLVFPSVEAGDSGAPAARASACERAAAAALEYVFASDDRAVPVELAAMAPRLIAYRRRLRAGEGAATGLTDGSDRDRDG